MQRNRELVNFLPVVILMMIGFASVYAARSSQMDASSLSYGLLFVGLFLLVHLFLRLAAPYADPFLLPLAALMSAIGIMMIYRIDPDLAAAQTTWLMVGPGLVDRRDRRAPQLSQARRLHLSLRHRRRAAADGRDRLRPGDKRRPPLAAKSAASRSSRESSPRF